MIRLGSGESFTVKGTPEHADGHDARRSPRVHVVRGVPDQHGVLGTDVEPPEAFEHGVRIRFVPCGILVPDHDAEIPVEADKRETLVRNRRRLARHDAELVPIRGQIADYGGHVVVAPRQPVVVLALVAAVSLEERRHFLFAIRIEPQLLDEGSPDSPDPVGVGGAGAVPPFECVAGRTEDELDRVDECAVEVEQHSRRASWARSVHRANGKGRVDTRPTRRSQRSCAGCETRIRSAGTNASPSGPFARWASGWSARPTSVTRRSHSSAAVAWPPIGVVVASFRSTRSVPAPRAPAIAALAAAASRETVLRRCGAAAATNCPISADIRAWAGDAPVSTPASRAAFMHAA